MWGGREWGVGRVRECVCAVVFVIRGFVVFSLFVSFFVVVFIYLPPVYLPLFLMAPVPSMCT